MSEKKEYKCMVDKFEFKTKAKEPRCPNCLSRMVKPAINEAMRRE